MSVGEEEGGDGSSSSASACTRRSTRRGSSGAWARQSNNTARMVLHVLWSVMSSKPTYTATGPNNAA